jgi:hypothetical protein
MYHPGSHPSKERFPSRCRFSNRQCTLPPSCRGCMPSSEWRSVLGAFPRAENAERSLGVRVDSALCILQRLPYTHTFRQWLHSILHRYEGDLCNSKAWTNGIDEEILAKCPLYQGNHQSKQPAHASAFKLIDQVGLARRSLQPSFLRKQYGDKNIKWPESAPTEDELVAEQKRLHDQADGGAGEIDGKCWEEICWLASFLGDKYGWDQNTEGTKGYTESTEEQKEISRKMVGGGEGIRKF